MRWGVVTGLFVALLIPAFAHADAKAELESGIEAYDNGRFREAAQHFSDAYAIDPRPSLLFNQAQAWRRDHETSGDPATRQRALDLYRIFLALPQVSDAQRVEATVHLRALETSTVKSPSPPPVVVAVAAPPPAAPATKRRTGLWIGLGVGLAVAAGALAVGLGVGLSQDGDSPRLMPRW